MSIFNLSYIFQHRLLKNSLIYMTSNILVRAIPFLLLPVLTRYLSPQDYGIVATFQVMLAIVMVFVNLNTNGAVGVNFFKNEKNELRVYIGNVIYINFFCFILTSGVLYLLKKILSHIINFPENWIPFIAIVALSQSIIILALTIWQMEQKPLPYGILQVLQTILNVSMSLIFIVLLGWKWEGRLLSVIFTSVIFGIISFIIIFIKRYLNFTFNKNHIRDALFFGIFLIPHALGASLMISIDRIFINTLVGLAATGIYTVGYQIGAIIDLLVTSFNQSWAPFLFEKLKENNYQTKVKIVKFTYFYFLCAILAAVLLSVIAPFLLKYFVGRNFYDAYKYVFWIGLGFAAEGMYYMVANYIFFVNKNYLLALVTCICSILNIILNYLLIKLNGPIGAAQANAITFFSYFFLTWVLSARVYKMPWFSLILPRFTEHTEKQ